MVTGMKYLLVICAAQLPGVASLVSYIINWANGSTFLVNDVLFKKNGLESWDTTAMFIWIFSQLWAPPLTLHFVKGLRKSLETFASDFNAKLKNLASGGKG